MGEVSFAWFLRGWGETLIVVDGDVGLLCLCVCVCF